MAFPATFDSFTNPNGTNTQDSPDHALQHTNANNTLVSIEAVVGTTSGTNLFKSFTAGVFPAKNNNDTFGSATLVGGTASNMTINNTTIGTPAITGGTYTSPNFSASAITTTAIADANVTGRKMKIDQSFGTTVTVGSFTAGPTAIISGTFTPNVVSNLLILVNTKSFGNAANCAAIYSVTYNGTNQGSVCGWEQPGAAIANITYTMGGYVWVPNVPASAGTVTLQVLQGASGTVIVTEARFQVLPFAA